MSKKVDNQKFFNQAQEKFIKAFEAYEKSTKNEGTSKEIVRSILVDMKKINIVLKNDELLRVEEEVTKILEARVEVGHENSFRAVLVCLGLGLVDYALINNSYGLYCSKSFIDKFKVFYEKTMGVKFSLEKDIYVYPKILK